MPFDASKYLGNPKKKRNCFDFLRYCYLKNKRKNCKFNKDICAFFVFISKIFGFIALLVIILFMFGLILDWYESNHKYSIAKPKITGYFIKREDGFTANGIYTVSSKEKDKGEKSAGLLFGEINCNYREKYCREELVSIFNIGGVYIFPHIDTYDITYRDKNRIIYSDGYKTSAVVDLNQETITKTIYKTLLQEKPKNQIDEFITNSSEIEKEVKRVIRKHLKKKFW